jgi:alpha/beta superfamily hydrolase
MACHVLDHALIVETVAFRSGPYRLEGELAYSEGKRHLGTVLLAGPHPLLGGTMHNNVIGFLGESLAARGIPTLRFDYRGVGGSTGPPASRNEQIARFWQTSHITEELDFRLDLAAARAFLRDAVGPGLPLALLGYSFGASLLPYAGAGDETPMILIAPTIGTHDYEVFRLLPNPHFLIAPEDDFATDAERVRQWFDRLTGPKRLVQARLDGHFFRGHEAWLAEAVFSFLLEHWR